MKRVHTAESLAEVGHLKNILQQNGIDCFVKNEQLSGAIGEVPFLECMPELWIHDDTALDKAQEIIVEQKAPAVAAEAWRCKSCDETNEGQFAACWNCGSTDA